MGCFKICFGTCNNHKVPTKPQLLLPSIHHDKMLVRFEPLQPTKPVSKSVIYQFNCRNKKDVLVDLDEKEKVSGIVNLGNRNCAILANEKEENIIGVDQCLDYSLLKLEETADLQDQDESTKSLNISKIGESSDKQLNGLYNVRQLLQEESPDSLHSTSLGHVSGLDNVDQLVDEESCDSLFSVSVGSKKKVNAAENDDVVPEESSDSLFSLSVGSRKQFNGFDNVDQLVQEESSDSLFSVSVGSKTKANSAENGDVLVHEESSDSLFSLSVESRKKFNGLDDADQEESSNSVFSVSVVSEKKVNVAENGDVLAQEDTSDSLISVSVEPRKHLIDLSNVDQSVQDESSDSLFSVSVGSQKKVNAAENGNLLVQEESLGLLFSVSLESRKQVNAVETDEIEVTSPISFGVKPVCKQPNLSPSFANSVLSPIENLTNWKKGIKVTTKITSRELKEHEKENMSSVQGLNLIPFSVEEPILKKLNTISKQQRGSHSKAEVSPFAVDTSLSSWLVKSDGGSSEKTPILAAFTCEELIKQHSPTLSPRRSPGHYISGLQYA